MGADKYTLVVVAVEKETLVVVATAAAGIVESAV